MLPLSTSEMNAGLSQASVFSDSERSPLRRDESNPGSTYSLSSSGEVDEGGVAHFTIRRSGGLSFPGEIQFQVKSGSAKKDLERTLRDNLPVQSVQVSRRLLPTRLEVTLVDQTPVARAVRQQEGGLEAGYVDREGQWIRINPAAPTASPSTAISIRGWTPERRSLVASLLQQQDRLNSRLLAITLHSDGAVSLRHQTLGRLDLGDDEQLLKQQMDAIVELDESMPSHLLQGNGVVIDLSNPDRPEIQLPVKPATPAKND